MSARLLGIVLVVGACSFDATGQGEPGVTAASVTGTGTGMGTTGGATTGEASLPTGETGGSGDGTNGMTGPGMTGMTGTSTNADMTGPVDPTTGEMVTTGVDPSTTTNVDPSTSTGCVEQAFFKDDDQDGYGDPGQAKMGCEAPDGYVEDNTDCKDSDAKVNPGADEVCGGGDNDCDGLTDEYNPPANVDCGDCKMFDREATLYHFCALNRSWEEAVKACEGRMAVLVKDDSQGLHEWLRDRLTDISANTGTWWLGARTPDGNHANFAWRDGSKLGAFQPWAIAAPYLLPGGTDCVRVTTPDLFSQWVDAGCNDKRPFICAGPLP
jgi:hypothetical protein